MFVLKYYAYLSIGGAVVNIVLNLIAIPSMGILGAALTSVATFLISTIMAFYAVREYVKKFSIRSSIIVPCFIGLSAMGVFYFTIFKHVSFWTGSVLFLAFYPLFFMILGQIRREELAFGWELLTKRGEERH